MFGSFLTEMRAALSPAPFQMTLVGLTAIVIFHNFSILACQQSAPFVALCTLWLLANDFIPAGWMAAHVAT